MHFTLTWDISHTGEKWKSVNEELQACIKEYSWVRPLTTFYVVKISSNADWSLIHSKLVEVAKKNTGVNFIMSPPLSSTAQYNGYLAENLWKEINERTQ